MAYSQRLGVRGSAVPCNGSKGLVLRRTISKGVSVRILFSESFSCAQGKKLQVQVPSERRAFWEKKYGCEPFIEDVQEIIDQQFSHAVTPRPLLVLKMSSVNELKLKMSCFFRKISSYTSPGYFSIRVIDLGGLSQLRF